MYTSPVCSPHSGEFNGENIRLGSRGDSYYEYLIKVWLQLQGRNSTYLYDMYEEAMKGVRHLLVRKSVPNGLVFVGELPYGPQGSFSPKMDHLVCGILLLQFNLRTTCFVYVCVWKNKNNELDFISNVIVPLNSWFPSYLFRCASCLVPLHLVPLRALQRRRL